MLVVDVCGVAPATGAVIATFAVVIEVALTVRVNVAAFWLFPLVPVIVYTVSAAPAVGVPEINPVAESKFNPLLSDGEIE